MKKYLNANSIILLVSGVALVAWGAWRLYRFRDFTFGFGMLSIGIGNIMFGATNGFADQTNRGRIMFRIAIVSWAVGLLASAYSMRYLI